MGEGIAATIRAIGPGGRRILIGGGKAPVLFDGTTGRPLGSPLPHGAVVILAAFSHDGRTLMTVDGQNVGRVWDAQGPASSSVVLQALKGGADDARFAPDGASVLVVSKIGHRLQAFDPATGAPKGPPPGTVPAETTSAVSPDLTTSLVRVRETRNGRAIERLETRDASGRPVGRPVVGPPYQKNAALGPRGWGATWNGQHLQFLDFETGRWIAPKTASKLTVHGIKFTDDGRFAVAIHQTQGRLFEVRDARSLGGMDLRRLVTAYEFRPGGSEVVIGTNDGALTRWSVPEAKPKGPALGRHESAVRGLSFSRDGRWLVSSGDDGTARVWDLDTGSPVGVPLVHSGPVARAILGPIGGRSSRHATGTPPSGTSSPARPWDRRSAPHKP